MQPNTWKHFPFRKIAFPENIYFLEILLHEPNATLVFCVQKFVEDPCRRHKKTTQEAAQYSEGTNILTPTWYLSIQSSFLDTYPIDRGLLGCSLPSQYLLDSWLTDWALGFLNT